MASDSKMEMVNVALSIDGGRTTDEVEADVSHGLAVHSTVGIGVQGLFSVTHVNSGFAFPWHFGSRQDAIEARDEITPLMDWAGASRQQVVDAIPEMGGAVREAMRKHGGRTFDEYGPIVQIG